MALTSLLLLLFAPGESGLASGQEADTAGESTAVPDTVSVIEPLATEDLLRAEEEQEEAGPRDATEEVTGTLQGLWDGFVGNLPRYGIVIGILVVAGILARLLRFALRHVLRGWERVNAITALSGVVLWLLGFGIAVSVLVGDVRALIGSLGLVGLALSWALQAPIESFTAWLLNSFRGYYRIGDRIAVGDVFGDVYRIDFLTTTVWEYGGADRHPGQVRAEQPTGRLITFPNSEVLSGSIVNFTRDFPFVWDEVEVQVANESDLRYARGVLEEVAVRVLGDYMREPAAMYEAILLRAGLESSVDAVPRVFVTLEESWTSLSVRYLVGARERRRWKTELSLAVAEELARAEHRPRILPVYPRHQVQMVDGEGRVVDAPRPPRRDVDD